MRVVCSNFTGGTEEAIDTILHSIDKAGFSVGKDITLAMDWAASEFYKDGKYNYKILREIMVILEILRNKLSI